MRMQGMEPPWTEDPILQTYRFTNVFRQLDKVTQHLNTHIHIDDYSDMNNYLLDVIVYRMFNHPDTFLVWKDAGKIVNRFRHKLCNRKKHGMQIFTGAYIITNAGSKQNKIDLVCDNIIKIKKLMIRNKLAILFGCEMTLKKAHKEIMCLPMHGPFVAYEVVTDLRWTMLKRAKDIMTWANAGPGCLRGLNRLSNRDIKKKINQERACLEMMFILNRLNDSKSLLRWWVPPLEMRDVEHSLCEFDKYMRVKNGEGRPRSKYDYKSFLPE